MLYVGVYDEQCNVMKRMKHAIHKWLIFDPCLCNYNVFEVPCGVQHIVVPHGFNDLLLLLALSYGHVAFFLPI